LHYLVMLYRKGNSMSDCRIRLTASCRQHHAVRMAWSCWPMKQDW